METVDNLELANYLLMENEGLIMDKLRRKDVKVFTVVLGVIIMPLAGWV